MPKRDVLVASLLAAVVAVLLVPLAPLGVDPHHDGIMLKPALDVLSGQVLYRDTFTQYGALTTYLQAMALWFEPTLLTLRLLTVAAYAVTVFFLYAAWRLILPRSLAVLSCGLLMLFIPVQEKDWLDQTWVLLPWSSVFALMFQAIGLYALFRLILGQQPARWGVVLGLSCACVFWCRQPVGVIMTGCLAVIWLALHWTGWVPAGHSRRTILTSILAGFLAVNALLLGEILISGAWTGWIYQNLVWPGKWSQNVGWHHTVRLFFHPGAGTALLLLLVAAALPAWIRPYFPRLTWRHLLVYFLCLGSVLAWQHERLLPALALREGGWVVFFPLLILVQAILSITRAVTARGSPQTTEYYLVAALAALSLGSLVQYYPLADPWHVLWALAPTFGLVVFGLWRWSGWPAPAVALGLIAAFLPAVGQKVQSATRAPLQPLVTLHAPAVLRGMIVPAPQARNYHLIASALQPVLAHRPDLPCALIGNDALFLCFVSNFANPSPYYVTWRNLSGETDKQQRWDYIQRVRPLMILHRAQWDAVNDFYHRSHYLPLLYLPDEALEIAVPQELADAIGLKVYGASPANAAATETAKP
jgi:hypothetical protein